MLEELHLQFLFQLTQAVRKRALRDEELLRRLREVLGLGNVEFLSAEVSESDVSDPGFKSIV